MESGDTDNHALENFGWHQSSADSVESVSWEVMIFYYDWYDSVESSFDSLLNPISESLFYTNIFSPVPLSLSLTTIFLSNAWHLTPIEVLKVV